MLLYGAKDEAVSGFCLPCVVVIFWGELATVDHLAMSSILTGRLSTWWHKREFPKWTTLLKPYFIFPQSHSKHLLKIPVFHPPTDVRSQTCRSGRPSVTVIQSHQHAALSFHLSYHSASAFSRLQATICSYLPMNKSLPHPTANNSLLGFRVPWMCQRCSSVHSCSFFKCPDETTELLHFTSFKLVCVCLCIYVKSCLS